MEFLFRALLRIYPPPFRERFGPEMLEHCREEWRRAASRGRVALCFSVLATALDLVRMGLVERVRPEWPAAGEETTGDGEVGSMIGAWLRDLRQAVRALRKAPGFTAAAVGTLALALGVNAGIFSVVEGVLLRPLPYPDADRLVYIAGTAPGSDLPAEFPLSPEFLEYFEEHSTLLEAVAGFNSFTATARAGDQVERLPQSAPTLSFFETVGARPVVGRLPRPGEGGRVALISHALWTSWFARDPEVVGRTYEFVDGPKEVIGVLGPDFALPTSATAAWAPVERGAGDITPGRFGSVGLLARMAPGTDPAAVAVELERLAKQLPEAYGGSAAYARVIERFVPVVRPLREQVVGEAATALRVLMGAVLLVLLIACANVAGLLTVRAEARGRDLAVRRAIGAGRGALLRGELAEAVVVAALAGAAALLLARLTLPLLLGAAPGVIPRAGEIHLSGGTIAFTLLASLAAALACGLVPSLRSSDPDLRRLRDGGRGTTRRTHRGRDALVVVQTALALTLLVGSGLLLRSFQHLKGVDPGYDTSGLLTFQFAPDQDHLVDGPTWAAFHRDFMERLRSLPGVEGVGIVENVPLDEGVRIAGFAAEGGADDPANGPRGGITFAGGDYFGVAGIQVLQGRSFTDEDLTTPGNVILSRAMADLLFPGEDPLGRQVRNELIQDGHTVVGVVEDVLQDDLRDAPDPLAYYPLVGPTPRSWAMPSPGYVVRTDRGEGLVPDVRTLVREVAPEAPLYRVYTMEDLVGRSMQGLSFTMLTLGVAAGLALLLGAIGLYGVLSYVVTQRTQEIGVRMALGAGAPRVRRMVVVQGARVVALGIALGLVASLASTRVLSGLLFGVTPLDPWTFGGMSLALAAVGLLASYVPAWRASRVDPMLSLREG
jgi:putative ABC transport system permease protein